MVPLGEQDGEHRRQPGEPGGGSPDRALFVLELMQEHGLTIEDIERITVHLPEIYLRPHQYVAAPRTYLEGSCSIQRRTALGILGAVPGHEWFTEERFADPVARDMASRIEIVEDPEGSEVFAAPGASTRCPTPWSFMPAAVTYTKSALMSNILGSPGYPMPTEMIEDKFHPAYRSRHRSRSGRTPTRSPQQAHLDHRRQRTSRTLLTQGAGKSLAGDRLDQITRWGVWGPGCGESGGVSTRRWRR